MYLHHHHSRALVKDQHEPPPKLLCTISELWLTFLFASKNIGVVCVNEALTTSFHETSLPSNYCKQLMAIAGTKTKAATCSQTLVSITVRKSPPPLNTPATQSFLYLNCDESTTILHLLEKRVTPPISTPYNHEELLTDDSTGVRTRDRLD